MSIGYVWTFQKMEVKLQDGNLQNVVLSVMWTYIGTDDSAQKSSSISGVSEILPPDPDSFTPFDNITFDQTVGWVSAVENVPSLESELSQIITSMINSDIVMMPPPFNEG